MAPSPRKSTRTRRRNVPAVTIHDVAARAGVSVATVSRVLNSKDLVREETSRQVLDAAKELRYVPNVAARSLSIRRSQTIGVVLPDVHGEYFSEVIRGIDVDARKEGYHILVSGSHADPDEMLEVIEAMRGRVDGLIVMAPDLPATSLREELASDIPLVLLNTVDDMHSAITIDNYGGARAMMRHLTTLGHKEIAFIKGPAHNADARERLRGYRQSMRAITGARAFEIDGDFTERAGHAAGMQIAESATRPTAIFAANDSMAVGALSALTDRGIGVPHEMTVVGFDDIPIAHYVTPPLTTIRVEISEVGRRSFAVLCESIRTHGQRQRAKQHECIGTTLVVRKSCGAPQSITRRGRHKGEDS